MNDHVNDTGSDKPLVLSECHIYASNINRTMQEIRDFTWGK